MSLKLDFPLLPSKYFLDVQAISRCVGMSLVYYAAWQTKALLLLNILRIRHYMFMSKNIAFSYHVMNKTSSLPEKCPYL